MLICRFIFILALAAVSSCTFASENISFEAFAAWDGFTKAGASQEITLSISSQQTINLNISIVNGDNLIRSRKTVVPDNNNFIKLLVPNVETDNLHVVLENKTHHIKLEKNIFIRYLQDDMDVIAVATNSPQVQALLNTHTNSFILRPRNALFPISADAYKTVTSIVIDDSTLMSFNAKQLTALGQYLNTCKPILTYQLSSQFRSMLEKYSHCRYPNIRKLTGKTISLKNVSLADDLYAAHLAKISNSSQTHLMQRIAVFSSVIFLYLILFVFIQKYLNLTANIISLLIIFIASPSIFFLAAGHRVEAFSIAVANNQKIATHRTYLTYTGNGAEITTGEFPVKFGAPIPLESKTQYELKYNNNESYRLKFKEPLFAQKHFRIDGETAFSVPLKITQTSDFIQIRNISDKSTFQGFIKWGERCKYFSYLDKNSVVALSLDKRKPYTDKNQENCLALTAACSKCILLEDAGDNIHLPFRSNVRSGIVIIDL